STAKAQYLTPGTDAQILVRSHAGLVGLTAAIKSTAEAVNPNMDISFSALRTTIEEGLLRDRLMARLSGFFAILAVLLAVVGLYVVISYMVAQRRKEIAIRMAFGSASACIGTLEMHDIDSFLRSGLVSETAGTR